MSKNEKKIANLLRRGGIKFKQEVSFSDLHGSKNSLLRFDFAVYRGERLICLIEADGSQHFQYTPFFHRSKLAFDRQREWDRQKNKYCLTRGIPLLRVPYWDIEDLTLQKLLSDPSYRVTSKFHNDNLIEQRCKK